jgi:hypothetical protein
MVGLALGIVVVGEIDGTIVGKEVGAAVINT